jgi:alpha-mannosidase
MLQRSEHAIRGPLLDSDERLDVFHKIHWTQEKVEARLQLIEPLVHRQKSPLDPFHYTELSGPQETPPFGADTGDWETIEPDSFWGPPRTDFLLKSRFRVPEEWSRPALYLPLGISGDFSHPETLVYLDGEPHAGCDRHHQLIELPQRVCDGEEHRLDLHGWTGLGADWQETDPTHRMQMRACYVVDVCGQTRKLLAAGRVALGLTRVLEQHDPARTRLLNTLYHAFCVLDTREPLGENFYLSVPEALEVLEVGLRESGPPMDVDLVCAGHAHLDVGWLWPVGQTRQKSGRTFHTVDHLMNDFEDYHFSQSQPQLYDYVRQDYPQLFERIKQRVKEGRWEVLGGLWVEADANLTGSESLARQLVLGRNFFREHFGDAESPVLWLPDVFGYTWSLPQLIKQAGLEYFFTIKIGWSQYNRMPMESFWWQGLDGTRVLTHFSTSPDPRGAHAGTYNCVVTPEQFVGTWQNFSQQESQDILLMAYGYGDGGGGPNREMLENLQYLKSAPSSPRAKLTKVGDFFRQMEERSGDRLPVWNGELYLEYHRGTYTTQAALKRGNRKCEVALQNLEFLSTWAQLRNDQYSHPADRVTTCWQLVCLNQFHDILPGSSIRQVNVEAQNDHVRVMMITSELQEKALEALQETMPGELLLFNPTSFDRQEPVHVEGLSERSDGKCFVDFQGRPVFQQGDYLFCSAFLPSYGVLPLHSEEGEPPEPPSSVSVSTNHLENRFLRIEFDDQARLVRIWDKMNQREVLPEGAWANQLQLFEDRPMQWDAWDVDIYYEDRQWEAVADGPASVVDEGPLVGSVRVTYTEGQSKIEQIIKLCCHSPRVDFETRVDWRERHTMLKAAFPVDVLAPEARYEIQWGHVSRATHRNTSWDWAKFECPAQKWVDLSEGDYGVSLLNDCKYGHDVTDGQLRITLLRSPTMPDPKADQGEHLFTYSLYPHAGSLDTDTIRESYFLNYPVISCVGEGKAAESSSLVRIEPQELIVETVKPAESGDGWVMRYYESQRTRGTAEIRFGAEVEKVEETNLLEEPNSALTVDGNRVTDSYTPFAIRTLKIE